MGWVHWYNWQRTTKKLGTGGSAAGRGNGRTRAAAQQRGATCRCLTGKGTWFWWFAGCVGKCKARGALLRRRQAAAGGNGAE